MRADVNISLKQKGSDKFGTKVEMKNLMGFKSIYSAINYEIARQKEILDDGGVVEQETRKWDFDKGESYTMRTKENAEDYRYFPDPDLLAVNISDEDIERIRKQLPPLPDEIKEKYITQYGLSEYDTDVILADKKIADFYEECILEYNKPKAVANWFTTEILARIKGGAGLGISKENLVWIIRAVDDKKIQRLTAKEFLADIWGKNVDA